MKNHLLLIVLLIFMFDNCQNTTLKNHNFYVDSLTGNDANDGLSPQKPWASLAKVNQHTFSPGDQLLFKSGSSYNGQLEPKGSGNEQAPIVIGSYGQGTKPRINGLGKKKYTLLLENVEHYEVKNLEITNRGETREAGRTGVLIDANNCGDLRHIFLDSLNVHDVNGSLVKDDGGGSAIASRIESDSIPSRFVGLHIENCSLYNCARNGIIVGGNYNRNHWYPSLDVIIRNNLLEKIPGDGIVPIGCNGALIEYNTMRDCPDILSPREAAAGIWPWSSDSTIIQYNEVSGHRSKWDGQGFDADYNCHGTVIQYNYSHDNFGGFLLVCNDGNSLGNNWNQGTENSLIQFNLSVNDGIRPYPTDRQGWFSPTFHITGPVKNTVISHNVILVPKKENREIKPVIVQMANWGNAWPENTTIGHNSYFTSATPIFHWGLAVGTANHANKTDALAGTDRETILKLLSTLIDEAGTTEKTGYEKLKNFIAKQTLH